MARLRLAPDESPADQARLGRIEAQLAGDDRLARLEAQQAAIQATLSERRVAETEAAEAIQRKLEETASASADALKSALISANDIELERVGRVNDRIAAVEKAAEVALASAEKAVTLTREDGIRTEGKQNEFRGALEDQAKRTEVNMMRRSEFEQAHKSLQAETKQSRDETRGEIQRIRDDIATLRQTVAVGPPTLRDVERRQDRGDGGASGKRESTVDARTWLLGLGVILVAIAGIVGAHI